MTETVKEEQNQSAVLNATQNLEKISLIRNKNVKKPFLSNDVVIFYTPRSITLKPRTSKQIDMGIIVDYADYLIPEYDLLPSFKTHLNLILPEEEEIKGKKLLITLINRSFSKTYRITKNTGLVSFTILNTSVNLYYTNKYITDNNSTRNIKKN